MALHWFESSALAAVTLGKKVTAFVHWRFCELRPLIGVAAACGVSLVARCMRRIRTPIRLRSGWIDRKKEGFS
jgi:hypothetical protein